MWYNKDVKGREKCRNCSRNDRKAGINMNAPMNLKRNEIREEGLVSENCNCSVYSMLTVAGGILLAIGTVIYSVIAAC